MTPAEQFLRSVRESFAANRTFDWTHLALLIVVVLGLSVALSVWLRRRRSRREAQRRIHRVSSDAGLSRADLDHLTRVSAVADVPLVEMLTRLAAFEHATAVALSDEAATPHPSEGSLFHRVRRVRKALGFSPLPAHHWLLTTRELSAGDSVTLGGARGQVAEINEASLAIDLPPTAIPTPGAVAALTIDRADDARYLARVRLLAVEPVPSPTSATASDGPVGRRAFFAHYEQPERQQHRQHVRVRVRATARLQIVDRVDKARETVPAAASGVPEALPPERTAQTTSTVAGTLVDLSAGGMSLDVPVSSEGPLPQGAQVRCWFTLDGGAEFESLAAVVLAATWTGPRASVQHIRLSFVSIKDGERDRLASAVAQHQRKQSPHDGES
jgi:hypothetical protein